MNSRSMVRFVALMATSALLPSVAFAQAQPTPSAPASNGLNEDIVVTANRRSEPLQKVGIAVNAFSGEQLRTLGVTNSAAITKFVPAVATTGAQGGFLQTFSIRGVTQNDYNPHQEGPVAVYTDDVYISSLQGQAFATFDTERVEILKGPQGTLFGRNATGGLVNFITNKPTDSFTGYLDAKYGSYNLRAFEGAVGGPISGDKVMFRVAGTYSAHDPILHNLIGKDGWAEESYAGRAELLIRPSDNFETLFTARYGKAFISNGGSNQYIAQIGILDAAGNQVDGRDLGPNETAQVITPAGPVGTRPCPGCSFFGYRDPDGSGDKTEDALVGKPASYNVGKKNRSFTESYGFTMKSTGHLNDEITLVNTMDYTHFKWLSADSLIGGPLPFGFPTEAKGIDQISDEFRVTGDNGPFRWTAGLYYLNIDSNNAEAFGFLPTGVDGAGAVPGDEVFEFRQRTSSISGFAQAEYDVAPKVTLIAGGRYIRDQKTFNYTADLVTSTGVSVFNLATFSPQTTPLANLTNNLWAAKAGLNYKPSQDILFYATVNRGVKGGGFNAPSNPSALTFDQFVFKPERLMAYEAGVKTSFLNHKLTVNATGFYYDYSNYQGQQSIGVTTFITNHKARTYGGELEVRANPVRHLNLMLGAAYTNALVHDVAVGPTYIVDRRPAFDPKINLNGLIRYEIPSPIGTFALQADASYRTSYYVQLSNYSDLRNAAYALVNARISLAGNDKAGWELHAGVDNLTDHRYIVSGFDVATQFGAGEIAYNKPRTFEVGVRYDF